MSSSGFTFTFKISYCDNYYFSFVPGRSREVQTHFSSFCTARDRPGTKTEIIIVAINVKVNPEEDTFAAICCPVQRSFPISQLFSFVKFKILFLGNLFFSAIRSPRLSGFQKRVGEDRGDWQ